MSKYDQLIKDLRDPRCGDGTTTHIDMRKEAAEAIETLLAADVRPVQHGRWVRLDAQRGSYRFYCSACGGMAYYAHGKNSRTKGEPTCGYSFCPPLRRDHGRGGPDMSGADMTFLIALAIVAVWDVMRRYVDK